MSILQEKVKVINIGLGSFARDLESAGVDVTNVDWHPAAGGDEEVLALLDKLAPLAEEIDAANKEALGRVLQAEPVLVDLGPAGEMIAGLPERTLLHAGPPLEWKEMSGPMRGAVIGAVLFEGWADSSEAAEALAASGQLNFVPCHHYDAVGPMTGMLSPSMPVFVVENTTFGNRAYCSINEGLGKVLRFGAYSQEVLKRLAWLRDEFHPLLKQAILEVGGIQLKNITSQALQMGDECHNRNKAASALLLRELAPIIAGLELPRETVTRALDFMRGNEHFYLNVSMAACKASLDPARGIRYSTMVTAMTRNGTDFGIKISGLDDQWFTAPALAVDGLYFPGYSAADANPDLGDSTITETFGIGGFAMASAPAIVKFVGGSPQDALEYSRSMYRITLGENSSYTIPNLNFRGIPTGIDLRKVLEEDILPALNTGIAHKDAGVGQIGAGVVNPPLACFKKALVAFVEAHLGEEDN
ncbi:MAG: DUF1116 domain-containing protein [Firmicutes bacterium]|nr:DUF1116 domain-containing protein [Bacillota bacterium]